MQRLIIDCAKKEEVWQDLTAQEEAARLTESQVAIDNEIAEGKKRSKTQLIKALMELREMRQNRDVFTDVDIGEKQAEIDELKTKV
jgi:hypothetical protein